MILKVAGVVEIVVTDVTFVIFPTSGMRDVHVVLQGNMAIKRCQRFTFMLADITLKVHTGGSFINDFIVDER